MANAIEIHDLGKQYRRKEVGGGRYKTLRESLMSIGWKKHTQKEEDFFWALRHVDLEIPQGEILGVIGPNGAGKSTLLKLLTRVTAPTEGNFTLKGRVASLLEVGTGFHPELTGRENIYLSGAIMGMRKNEIKRKFDEIVDFSGVEKFLDLPVKRYSSGMFVRLGFAVAAHLEAEILLVDEVLAVGDAAFQKKCLGKMGDVAQQGRTVLFVSHNLGVVKSLCKESVLLVNGNFQTKDDTQIVIKKYLQKLQSKAPSRIPERKKGVGEVIIQDVRINGVSVWDFQNKIDGNKEMLIETEIFVDDNRAIQINIGVYKEGIRVFTLQDVPKPIPNTQSDKILRSTFIIPGSFLRKGSYVLGVGGNLNGVRGDWFWSKEFYFFTIFSDTINTESILNFGIINLQAKTFRL